MPAQTNRRRMTREEALRRQEQKRRIEEKRQESKELSHGPIDLPFCLLVLLLTAIGLVMLLSASFPSAQLAGDALYYFKRQAIFAVLGVLAMFSASKINYQRFRGLAKIGLIVSLALLVLVLHHLSEKRPQRKENKSESEPGLQSQASRCPRGSAASPPRPTLGSGCRACSPCLHRLSCDQPRSPPRAAPAAHGR